VAQSIRSGSFLELAELIDLRLALGEHGFNLQLASHGSNHGLQSADVHIGAALHPGDHRLVDAEQVEGLAQPTRKAPGLHSRLPPFRKERGKMGHPSSLYGLGFPRLDYLVKA
jgi:hypothetical protein